MKLSDLNPFRPANPQAAEKFLADVQPSSPMVTQKISCIARNTWQACRDTLGLVARSPAIPFAAAGYLMGNITGAVAAVSNKIGSLFDKAGAKVDRAITGKGAEPGATG